MKKQPLDQVTRESVREFFKPYLKHQFMLLAVAGIVIVIAFILWFRKPTEVSVVEKQRQKVLCTLWRNNIHLQLASLRTKFITDQDAYLFQGFQRLENTINSELTACHEILKGYQPRIFTRNLETLAIQLIQKDDLTLNTLNDIENIFISD